MHWSALLWIVLGMVRVYNKNIALGRKNEFGGEILRIAALQLDAAFADVKTNVEKCRHYIKQAADNGAELIVLPEFFSSAIGFSDKMLDVAAMNRPIPNLLKLWAKDYQIAVCGSYIFFDGHNAYNLFSLIFPNGQSFEHKKDIPTQFENCYYTRGDEDNILYTPIGDIGMALCWEMLRYDTLRRLSGKVSLVLAGSCWWDLPIDSPAEREPLRHYNQTLAVETPVTFAKLLGVPLVHASHCGTVTALRFPDADKIQTRRLVGAAQIINADGNIASKRRFNEGEGLVISDIAPHKEAAKKFPEQYWIPDLPTSYLNAWEKLNP